MTLYKGDIVKGVIEQVHLKRRVKTRQQYLFPELDYVPLKGSQANRLVNSLFEIMKSTLERGESILISRFGKFQVKFKWAGKARNPRTGEMIIVKSRRIVTFRGSPKLRIKINQP